MEKLKMHSRDNVAQNIETVGRLFPNALTEVMRDGKVVQAIDFDVLRQELSREIVEGREEHYAFTWPGKRQASLAPNTPIAMALRPVVEDSVGRDGRAGAFDSENLYIEGDNLDVLKLLQETYLGKVKMIYIDPPYNTGNDSFVYDDDFTMENEAFKEANGLYDEDGNVTYAFKKNLDSNGRFHTDWLNMIYPRLKVAKNLLTEDGVIFISIDNMEVKNLMKICDELFGENNFIDCITWNKRVPKNDNNGIGNIHEYILVYVKNSLCKRQFTVGKKGLEDIHALLSDCKRRKVPIEEAETKLKQLYKKNDFDRGITLYNCLDDNYEPWGKINMSWPNADTFGTRYEVIHPSTHKPTKIPDRGWRWTRTTFESIVDYQNAVQRFDGSWICGRVWFAKDENTQPSSIKYLREVDRMLLRSIVSLKSDGGIEIEKIFDGKSYFPYPKPVSLIKLLLHSMQETEGIYLDFFSGSATTAHAVMQLNAEDGGHRKFIMVQLPEATDEKSEAHRAGYANICEIGKERIRRAGAKIAAEAGEKATELDLGFRCLRLDTSNMTEVYYTPDDVTQDGLFAQIDNVKADRTPEDLLFQTMLDLGILLSASITVEEIAGKRVFNVADGFLLACFDRDVTDETVTAIAKRKPYYAVFRDASMADDSALTNFDQLFAAYSPATVRKVL